MIKYFCAGDAQRRSAIQRHATLNGIDFLEVLDTEAMPLADRQRFLRVHLFKPLAAPLTAANLAITGGDRMTDVMVVDAQVEAPAQPQDPAVLVVELDQAGDFSTYTLRLQRTDNRPDPPDNFDPIFSAVDFSFKVNCPTDFDCLDEPVCPPDLLEQPLIDYLAKDYASFRQLMLDRMSVVAPNWQARNPADMGVALVELLAYVGDYLSYRQDAVATESYLETARLRTSVRRHARLVDYAMHDGANARVWVQVRVRADDTVVGVETQLLTRLAGVSAPTLPPNSSEYDIAVTQSPTIFETMHAANLYVDHNEFFFYTWGATDCCLPRGATTATLQGRHDNLKAGDLLIFIEQLDPRTGEPEDADPTHRHAVRLLDVRPAQDPLGGQLTPAQNDQPVDVTEIRWHVADALPFPLCISGETSPQHGSRQITDVTIALGNILLADHGATFNPPEALPVVPSAALWRVPAREGHQHNGKGASVRDLEAIPPRYRPPLAQGPVTMATPFAASLRFEFDTSNALETALDNHTFSAALQQAFAQAGLPLNVQVAAIQGREPVWSVSDQQRAFRIERAGARLHVYDLLPAAHDARQNSPQSAQPSITLTNLAGDAWVPVRDLLASAENDPHFVVESEAGGNTINSAVWLRFGDDRLGARPPAGEQFLATYRVGNGAAGNIGADTLAHLVIPDPNQGIERVWNPLPAHGGVDPESVDNVRRLAPYAYRTQARAVTPEDYAEVTQRHPEVQRAAVTQRYTGSWHTLFVTIDRVGGKPIDAEFEEEMLRFLDGYRMAGHDIEIDSPHFVPLEIEMTVCVKRDYFRSQVRRALLQTFTAGLLPDGTRGVFHPDRFSFAQPVFLSPIYAAAEAVDGVEFVTVTTFQRWGNPQTNSVNTGKLELQRLEIARLDNDPSFPDRGVFRLTLEGGK